MNYLEALEKAKALPQNASTPIYQPFEGRENLHFYPIYCEQEPDAVSLFRAKYRKESVDIGSGYLFVHNSKMDDNGNILPHKMYNTKLMFRKKHSTRLTEVTNFSYEIVGLKRESTHLPAGVIIANVDFDVRAPEERERQEIKKLLAADRHALCPEGFSKRRFYSIRADMERRYMREFLNTPDGLYTSATIWKQTFGYLLK